MCPEYNTEPDGRQPDTQGLNATDRVLPLPSNISQKSSSVRRVFIKRFITAVAIVADAGGLDQNLWFLLGALDCFCDGAASI